MTPLPLHQEKGDSWISKSLDTSLLMNYTWCWLLSNTWIQRGSLLDFLPHSVFYTFFLLWRRAGARYLSYHRISYHRTADSTVPCHNAANAVLCVRITLYEELALVDQEDFGPWYTCSKCSSRQLWRNNILFSIFGHECITYFSVFFGMSVLSYGGTFPIRV